MADKTMKDNPKFSGTLGPLKVVVEGVGDVVMNYYEPALRAVMSKLAGKREIHTTFVDDSKFWRDSPALADKMQGIITTILHLQADHLQVDYLDKSKPADLAKYESLKPDVVIIATPDSSHVEVAERWLNYNPRQEQIFIEKPLTDSMDAARRLLGKVKPYDPKILAYDHYRARLLPAEYEMHVILGFLGEGVRSFKFYFLEDHSGADPRYNPAVNRDGPIENEQRVKTLNQGVILDGMPHAIALLAHFCRVETLRVTRVKAGQYVGVDGVPDKRTDIDNETFAAVKFVCDDYAGNQVKGAIYVGKGVRGVKALGQEYDHNVKLLEIEGINGERIRFDLRSSGIGSSLAHLIGTRITIALNKKPYETFLNEIANGTYHENRLGLPVETGKRILELLDDMRYPIPKAKDKNCIPTYPSGMKGVRDSLYLEDILDMLPKLWGP